MTAVATTRRSKAEMLWAELLFCSPLHADDKPSHDEVQAAVMERERNAGYARCAELMAFEYGDHPEEAARRMSWCLRAVHEAFA